MTKKFEKELLYKKESTQLIDRYLKTIPKLESIQRESEAILKRKLSDADLMLLANNTKQFVIELKNDISSRFAFAEATTSFNLQALGIDYRELDDRLSNLPQTDFKYLVTDGKIQQSLQEIERLNESCKVYTTTQKQNDLLKVCEDLSKGFQKLDELFPIGAAYEISRGTNNILKVGWNDAGKAIPVVNHEMIEYIK